MTEYLKIAWTLQNPVDIAQLLVTKAPYYSRHSMLAADRLGNPDTFEIPIAMAFGEQDFL